MTNLDRDHLVLINSISSLTLEFNQQLEHLSRYSKNSDKIFDKITEFTKSLETLKQDKCCDNMCPAKMFLDFEICSLNDCKNNFFEKKSDSKDNLKNILRDNLFWKNSLKACAELSRTERLIEQLRPKEKIKSDYLAKGYYIAKISLCLIFTSMSCFALAGYI